MMRLARYRIGRSAARLAVALALAGGAAILGQYAVASEGRVIPAPVVDETAPSGRGEVALLAGGCFWGVQGVFQHVDGVTSAVSGYSGGAAGTANYQTVSGGSTGHAEVVRITFDPARISYGRILQIFFSVAHDPTQVNRQGPDAGTQYRSAIFPQSATQSRIAQAYIAQLDQAGTFGRRIATRIEGSRGFFPAEAYHQNYMTRHPSAPYIATYDLPMLGNLSRFFPSLYRGTPVLVATSG